MPCRKAGMALHRGRDHLQPGDPGAKRWVTVLGVEDEPTLRQAGGLHLLSPHTRRPRQGRSRRVGSCGFARKLADPSRSAKYLATASWRQLPQSSLLEQNGPKQRSCRAWMVKLPGNPAAADLRACDDVGYVADQIIRRTQDITLIRGAARYGWWRCRGWKTSVDSAALVEQRQEALEQQ